MYGYCINNPISYVDILGMALEKKFIDNRKSLNTYYDKDNSNFDQSSFKASTILSTPANNDEVARKTAEIQMYVDRSNYVNGIIQSIAEGIILKDLASLLPNTDSHVLKDEAGRSLNIYVGDNVYITTATWTRSKGSDVTYVEMRVKVIRGKEIIFNDVFYWTF